MRNSPASNWRFFAEASSCACSAVLRTGPLEIEPGAEVDGSSKFAYSERPVPRGGGTGVEEFDMIGGCIDRCYGAFESHTRLDHTPQGCAVEEFISHMTSRLVIIKCLLIVYL